jgi:octaprenyl-diphosphate synthase
MLLGRTWMLTDMNEVWHHYRAELDEVESQIQRSLDSPVSLINTVGRYVLSSGGKRFRPLLLLISSRLCGSQGKDHIPLASVVEFIHTATLLHDDVIDEAEIRRGKRAARTLWGNQASILVGDFCYAQAICEAIRFNNFEINRLLADTCRRMTEGESLQLASDGDPDLTEEVYLKTIEYKTASLIATACLLGGIVSRASDEKKEALSRFGVKLGMAFQVADDTLDYVAEKEKLGKLLGKDFREGKITLPLLHLLQHCVPEDGNRIRGMLTRGEASEDELRIVLALMDRYGSIAYAIQRAREFVEQAKKELSVFEESVHRRSLCIVADYVVSRDH